MSPSDTASPHHRRDIDGLRAIAVLSVIGFHADLPGFSGGYVGVDVFFVISGYVITGLIVRELEAGRFSLWRFYERRFRRLLPALSVVLLACLLPAWWWMLPHQLVGFGYSVLAVVGMLPNVYFWRNTGYFDAAVDDHPLLHTWSLGIEEQFYVGFALLLPLAWRWSRQRLDSLLLPSLCLASLLLCVIVQRYSTVIAFYLLPFRAWELLVGAVMARVLIDSTSEVAIVDRASTWSRIWQQSNPALPWAGLAGLVFSVGWFNAQTPFPSLWTLVPVLSAAAVLLAAPTHAVSRALGCKPLVGVGLISYSAYLWHYPVFAFAKLAWLQTPGHWATAGLVAAVMVAATLSWRYVEQPARRGSSFAVVVAFVGACLLAVCGYAGWVVAAAGRPDRLPAGARQVLALADSKNPRQAECLALSNGSGPPPGAACRMGQPNVAPTVALVGDSHADALFEAMDQSLREAGIGARFMAYGGCPPVPGAFRTDMRQPRLCSDYFTAAYRELAAHPEIGTVVLAARWSTYLEGDAFDNGEGGREPGKPLIADAPPDAATQRGDRRQRLANAYRRGVGDLIAMGKQVILVYPVPEVGWNVPDWIALHQMRGRPLQADLSTDRTAYDRRNQRLEQAFSAIKADVSKLRVVRPADVFCSSDNAGRCMAQIGGVPLYYDSNHLNRLGAEMLVARISAATASPTRR